ncbi:Immunity protein Imm2 [Pseudomonas flavescens]|uniref:Immunity protein Imm2 n=2 Tax=Phytopseudomonas flavescens TaxID=29435 RepID=A0A1G8M8E3_9GAMM|nr:Immunity protein Imm2 [Pseudomonas flavescens]
MLEVVSFVLSCWYPAQAEQHKDRIYSLLSENNLEKMLEEVPNDELDEFRHDLSILGFL